MLVEFDFTGDSQCIHGLSNAESNKLSATNSPVDLILGLSHRVLFSASNLSLLPYCKYPDLLKLPWAFF